MGRKPKKPIEPVKDADFIPIPDKFLYKCDPAKNDTCKKTFCQGLCFYTSKKYCRADEQKYYADPISGDIKPWEH